MSTKVRNTVYELKRKNPITLGDDSNIEANLKPIKIDSKNSILELSENELKVRGTIDASAITVDGASVQTGDDVGAITALNSATENELVTVGATTTELDAETNLTFDGTGLKIGEVAAASSDTAGYGQIWVDDAAPNELCFTDDVGTDIVGVGKYHYETKLTNFYGGATGNYLNLSGYTVEKTSTAGNNETISMIAPYNGTIEKICWRSEIAQDGGLSIRLLESSDGTEVPGSLVYRKDDTVDINDDTYTEYDLTSPSIGSYPIPLTKGKIFCVFFSFASAPQDTNITIVFKWDITS